MKSFFFLEFLGEDRQHATTFSEGIGTSYLIQFGYDERKISLAKLWSGHAEN